MLEGRLTAPDQVEYYDSTDKNKQHVDILTAKIIKPTQHP
jgi:hypothetical protein